MLRINAAQIQPRLLLKAYTMNAQIQADEVETLKAIYDEDFHIVSKEERTYMITIQSDHLHLELMFIFPEDYPGNSYPVYEIRSAPWISRDDLDNIEQNLLQIFYDNGGEVVVYQWVEWLREFVSERAQESQQQMSEQSDTLTTKDKDIDQTCESKLSIGKKVDSQTARSDVVSAAPPILHGEPLTDRKSTFQAHAAEVTTVNEVKAVVLELKQNRKIATATHNILAYRIFNLSKGTYLQDCDDDGEAAAGGRLLHLLQIMDLRDMVVVVTRWYGGIHLHADRFKHINNVARTLIQETGIGLKHKEALAGNSKEKKHSKAASKSKGGKHR